jgi:hypothetical protein
MPAPHSAAECAVPIAVKRRNTRLLLVARSSPWVRRRTLWRFPEAMRRRSSLNRAVDDFGACTSCRNTWSLCFRQCRPLSHGELIQRIAWPRTTEFPSIHSRASSNAPKRLTVGKVGDVSGLVRAGAIAASNLPSAVGSIHASNLTSPAPSAGGDGQPVEPRRPWPGRGESNVEGGLTVAQPP